MNKQELFNYIYFIAPFIIVCYFLFFSMINMDLSGIVYLIGLLSCTMLTVFIGNILVSKNRLDTPNESCQIVTINHFLGISNIPISLIVYCFTAGYIIYTSAFYNGMIHIFAGIVFLSSLIGIDIYWLYSNNCFSYKNIVTAFVIGSLFGIGWGYFINLLPNKSLQYVPGYPNMCRVPKKKSFKCNNGRREANVE